MTASSPLTAYPISDERETLGRPETVDCRNQPAINSHLDRDQKSVSAPTLALPEQEYTPGDTLSDVPYVPLSLVSSTRL